MLLFWTFFNPAVLEENSSTCFLPHFLSLNYMPPPTHTAAVRSSGATVLVPFAISSAEKSFRLANLHGGKVYLSLLLFSTRRNSEFLMTILKSTLLKLASHSEFTSAGPATETLRPNTQTMLGSPS